MYDTPVSMGGCGASKYMVFLSLFLMVARPCVSQQNQFDLQHLQSVLNSEIQRVLWSCGGSV